MSELLIKVDVPKNIVPEFRDALKKILDKFVSSVEFSLASEILSKSELTERQAKKLTNEVNVAVAKRHGVM